MPFNGEKLGAEDIRLKPHVGQCEYTFNPIKDSHNTSCSAEALLVNAQTSELFFCRGSVEGDQFVAPSVPETAQLEGSFVQGPGHRAGKCQRSDHAEKFEPCCCFQCHWSSGRDVTVLKNVSTMIYSAHDVSRQTFAKSDAAMTTGFVYQARGSK